MLPGRVAPPFTMLVTVGVPVVVMVNVPGAPFAKVAAFALVIAGGTPVVNENAKSAARFWPTLSVTCAATTVTVQMTLPGIATGVSTKVVAVAGSAAGLVGLSGIGVPTGHCSVNAPALAVTDSLKVTLIVDEVTTGFAPFSGIVE